MIPTPISSYEFENNVLDSTGTNHGTVTGNEQYTTGKIGNAAFDFDGSTRIALANESNFDRDINQPFSIAFWVKSTVIPSATDIFISKGAAVGSAGYFIAYGLTTGDVQFRIVAGATTHAISSTTPMDDGIFHHVVATFSGNSNRSDMKIYIDGILETTGTAQAMSGSSLNNDAFTIGAESDGGRVVAGDVFMDDVRFYNIELTAPQIAVISGL